MKSWFRFHIHPDPNIGKISCLAVWDGVQYSASVVEPEGERRVRGRVTCGDDEDAARQRADQLLMDAYTHDCQTQQCEPWRAFGVGGPG